MEGEIPLTTPQSTSTITSQPKVCGSRRLKSVPGRLRFEEGLSERAWSSSLFTVGDKRRSGCLMCCCWPYYRYAVSSRLGETPFMPLIPCAAFALRIKIRALLSIKGSLIGDFFTALCCEPCVVCQMTRELDVIGL